MKGTEKSPWCLWVSPESSKQAGAACVILTTSLELDCVAEEEDTGPDEEFEECLLRDSEALLLHFPRASFSSDRLLLHLSNCWVSTIKVTPFPEKVAKIGKRFFPLNTHNIEKASKSQSTFKEKVLPLHDGSGLFCKPHCLDIQSLYVATSSVTLIILPNMLHRLKQQKRCTLTLR